MRGIILRRKLCPGTSSAVERYPRAIEARGATPRFPTIGFRSGSKVGLDICLNFGFTEYVASSLVTCSYCKKGFLKDNRHINENRIFGHKFYCSRKCQYTSKNTQRELTCENPNCLTRFRREISHISFRNFCSRSCYGTLVTLRNKSKRKSFKYCLYCGERIDGRFNYCSPKCWGLAHQISKEELINKLQVLAKK